MRLIAVLCFFLFLFSPSRSQTKSSPNPGSHWYVSWGYTKAVYSQSSIHMQNLKGSAGDHTGGKDFYDFTLLNATAHDRPDMNKLTDLSNLSIPQFVCRAGYYFNEKWALELNYDHTKYVVDDYQKVHIKGQIDGTWMDKDTTLDPVNFFHFEHTDGANFLMLNAVRKWNLCQPSARFQMSWVLKPGAGIVIPRTDVTLFGSHLNNDWKVAGYIVGVETGLRLEFLKYGMFELVTKGSYANYVNAFVLGKGNGKASHHFYAAQVTATIGFKFGT